MFNKKVIFSVIAMLMMVLMSFGMVSAQDITVQGSSTVLPVAQKAAEVYMDNNPNVNISVRGGGSGNGIAALIDGSTDIADASRFIKFEEVENAVENGIYPVPHRIAMDGIAVVVNNANPIEDLSLEEIKSIYTGRITNWSDLDGIDFDKEIVIVSRDSSSGTFGVFNDVVNDGKIDGNPIRLTPTALTQSSNGDIAGTVADTEGAIGYVGLGYLSDNLKAVKVEGVKPTNATVANGQFPIARPLYMFTDGWPQGEIKKFLNFVLSTEGQKLIEQIGYVPLH